MKQIQEEWLETWDLSRSLDVAQSHQTASDSPCSFLSRVELYQQEKSKKKWEIGVHIHKQLKY